MPNQQKSGGNRKHPRRPRPAHMILKQERRLEKWLRKLKSDPKAQRPRKRAYNVLDLSVENVKPLDHIRPTTFDNEYRSYRITKGRRGLNPSAEHRQDENPWVINKLWVGRFPITSLMEKPIQYTKPQKY